MNGRFLAFATIALLLGSCKSEPAKAPEEPKELTQKREPEGEPLRAPPPGYGNKVVRDEPQSEQPENSAGRSEAGPDSVPCKAPHREGEAADDAECVKSGTF